MDHKKLLHQYRSVLGSLSELPKQILEMNHNNMHNNINNIPLYVLHRLCNENCFNLSKAAYFVDNPDFNCVKGIAGFCKSENYQDDILTDFERFNSYMNESDFHKKVRSFNGHSLKRNNSFGTAIEEIIDTVGFNNPSYCIWDLKHFNHGLLVYEQNPVQNSDLFDEHFINSLYLLSFCPVH